MRPTAERQKTIVRVPVVLEPIEVQVPPLAIPVEIRDVAVAIRVLPDQYAMYYLRHHSLITLGIVSDLELLNSLVRRTG